jgi:hypothetical protein
MRILSIGIELGPGMELSLNIAWMLLATAMVLLWLHFGLYDGSSRRSQLIALAILVMIVFPVISVSDDLQALQNPAEADCYVRRDHVVTSAHSILPAAANLPLATVAELPLGVLRVAAPGHQPVRVAYHPGLAAIDNRPPPAA